MTCLMADMGKRLRQARLASGFPTAAAAARRLGMKVSTYAAHENEQNGFDADQARVYSRAFSVSASWLLTAEGTAPSAISTINMQNRSTNVIELAPYKVGINNSAGDAKGEINVGRNAARASPQENFDIQGLRIPIRSKWHIPSDFLVNELGVAENRASIVSIRGDSMAPSLLNGDRVIVDLNDIDIGQGGMFAVLDEQGSVIVKQVEILRGHRKRMARCSSRNPAYAPFDLPLDSGARIVGRVVARITRIDA